MCDSVAGKFKCVGCGRRYRHKKDLKKHFKNSKICWNTVLHFGDWTAIEVLSEVIPKFECPICSKSAQTQNGLKIHTARMHPLRKMAKQEE